MIRIIIRRTASATLLGMGLLLASGAMAATIYTETNSAQGNEVQIYETGADGVLALAGQVSTGGLGTGAGLGNQGALALTTDHRWLFAVNAGSNEISSFALGPTGLSLVARVASGGTGPVSVTAHENLLYVLNAGGTGEITGFTIQADGHLVPIAHSGRPLSSNAAGAAQIAFDRDGERLVVTEKATNKISVYAVDDDGRAAGPSVHPSNGPTPFGFAFDRRNDLLVSEAFGGHANAAALSSYDLNDDSAALQLISGSVPSNQTAACWVVLVGHYAYVTNTGSGTITGYRVSRAGELTRLSADGRTGLTGGGPTDAAASRDGNTLYVLSPSIGQIVTFHVNSDGTVTTLASTPGAPATATGLIAR